MPWIKLGDVVAHVRMSRPPRKRCATCKQLGAGLECDGCDKKLCASCAVRPKDELDFCPACFAPAWKHWLGLNPGARYSTKSLRRMAFREWSRNAAETFLRLVGFPKPVVH